jgi:hypothetical protein
MLYNEACKKYKMVFKEVGAKMWHDDDAHTIPHTLIGKIVENMRNVENKEILKIWGIIRPLTILDSYPNIRKDKKIMKNLNKQVDKIYHKYFVRWVSFLNSVA